MAKEKYKKRLETSYAVQYDGTNVAEMTEFCPECVYDADQGKLMYNFMPVEPTNWILQDNGGVFTMMVDDQFVAFFDLAP